jgi:hypothetical protein
LLAVQQGTATYNVFSGMDVTDILYRGTSLEKIDADPKFKSIPVNKGQQLCNELNSIKCGKGE